MIRNLRVLVLALAAVFALSAAIAESASAELTGEVTSDGASVTLEGTEIGGTAANFFEALSSSPRVECPGSTIASQAPVGTTELTVTPTYRNCNVGVDMNGCDYDLKDAQTVGATAGTYGLNLQITCSGTNKIRITLSPCNMLIGPQTIYEAFHLTNTSGSPDDIQLSGEAFFSATACGFPTNGRLVQNLTIQGRSSTGGATEVTLSHN